MKYEIPGTLAYYQSAPQYRAAPLKHLFVPKLAINCKAFVEKAEKESNTPQPAAEAFEFYLLNHLASVVRSSFTSHERLAPWAVRVMDAYTKVLANQGQRMFHYMLLITTRESRHLHGSTSFYEELTSKFGSAYMTFHKSIKGLGSTTAANVFQKTPPEMYVGAYTSALTHTFFNGSFSSSYGGKPWGNIAATLERFVNGESSMEVLVDTAYTLAHNNGPMFNKGMLYEMYSNDIYAILDVQRSGQIPELAFAQNKFVSSSARIGETLVDLAKEVNAETSAFGAYVDWYKVEALGALKTYTAYKQQQDVMVAELEKEAAIKSDPNMQYIMDLEIYPGQVVQVFQRKKSME